MQEVKRNFFDDSVKKMLCFFVREELLTAEELQKLLEEMVVLPLCRVSYSVNADETVTSIVETQDLAFRAEAMIVEANRWDVWQQRKADGTTIYCHAAGEVPFSWMHSIVISQQDYEQNAREVLLHEQAHICCGHSFDILLLAVVSERPFRVRRWPLPTTSTVAV